MTLNIPFLIYLIFSTIVNTIFYLGVIDNLLIGDCPPTVRAVILFVCLMLGWISTPLIIMFYVLIMPLSKLLTLKDNYLRNK